MTFCKGMPASMPLYGYEAGGGTQHADKILAGEITFLRNIEAYTSSGKLRRYTKKHFP
jgi:hypothetical protein